MPAGYSRSSGSSSGPSSSGTPSGLTPSHGGGGGGKWFSRLLRGTALALILLQGVRTWSDFQQDNPVDEVDMTYVARYAWNAAWQTGGEMLAVGTGLMDIGSKGYRIGKNGLANMAPDYVGHEDEPPGSPLTEARMCIDDSLIQRGWRHPGSLMKEYKTKVQSFARVTWERHAQDLVALQGQGKGSVPIEPSVFVVPDHFNDYAGRRHLSAGDVDSEPGARCPDNFTAETLTVTRPVPLRPAYKLR